jgi:hypothetical protein
LNRYQYAYGWIAAGSGGGRTLTRTEQHWNSGTSQWVDDARLSYSYDALERQYYEAREEYPSGLPVTRYDTTQSYDKNGNRTGSGFRRGLRADSR